MAKQQLPKISTGDKVHLIFTDEVGVVTAFFDGETAMVMIDGTEVPVFIEHLKKIANPDAPSIHAKSKNKAIAAKEARINKERKREEAAKKMNEMGMNTQPIAGPDKGISLALQAAYTQESVIDYFLIHLINDTGHALSFAYTMYVDGYNVFQLDKKLGGRASMVLNTLAYDQLNERPELVFDFKLLGGQPKLVPKFNKTVKPRAKLLRKSTKFIPLIDVLAYPIILLNSLPIVQPTNSVVNLRSDLILSKETPSSVASKETLVEPNQTFINERIRTVDLHIHALMKSYKHLRKSEILYIQLSHFDKELQTAILRKELNMIAIHGLGKGKLKQEIFKILRTYPEVLRFKNEYHGKYGFGATEIVFGY